MPAVRRVALVSDVHGNLPALEAVAHDIAARGVTRVVNLGDHVSGPLWPRETAARLMALAWPALAGNHDRMVVHDPPEAQGPSDRFAAGQIDDRQRAWLAAMPPTLALVSEGLFLCHGIPDDDRRYLLETPVEGRLVAARPDQVARRLGGVRAPVVACGHSHVPRVVWYDGCLLVNPGAVGLPAYEHTGAHPHVSETGAPQARYAVVRFEDDRPAAVDLVAVSYDAASAAARAAANGRPDWAHALATGFARP